MIAKYLLVLLVYSASCNSQATNEPVEKPVATEVNAGKFISPGKVSDIPLPPGYVRIPMLPGSFSEYLGSILLKADKTVYLYNGEQKQNQQAQFAVLDISVGKKDLQQCADAIMRLRAEFLFSQKRFSEIIFRDNDGKSYVFNSPYTRERFESYLLKVFGFCGSASLSKSLSGIDIKTIAAGDVFIRGGFPGHAVIVMDVAVNENGKKIYLLAQSYMPAQDIHILLNPMAGKAEQPWYSVDEGSELFTPEYNFLINELKTW
ncbi:MAG: DUF4846 domain-containing protein [Chitinophagaceae bacterium]